LQRTALCARKIGAILKPGISPIAIPIYRCAAAEAQAVGRVLRSTASSVWYGSFLQLAAQARRRRAATARARSGGRAPRRPWCERDAATAAT